MRQFKLIVFLFLLSGFTSTPARVFHEKTSEFNGKTQKNSLAIKKEQNTAKDQIAFFKRKVKTKGLLVIVPHIPKIYYLEAYVYNEYFFKKESKDYYCSLHYVPCKRGPPSLNI